jgi:hypothetical protein
MSIAIVLRGSMFERSTEITTVLGALPKRLAGFLRLCDACGDTLRSRNWVADSI